MCVLCGFSGAMGKRGWAVGQRVRALCVVYVCAGEWRGGVWRVDVMSFCIHDRSFIQRARECGGCERGRVREREGGGMTRGRAPWPPCVAVQPACVGGAVSESRTARVLCVATRDGGE